MLLPTFETPTVKCWGFFIYPSLLPPFWGSVSVFYSHVLVIPNREVTPLSSRRYCGAQKAVEYVVAHFWNPNSKMLGFFLCLKFYTENFWPLFLYVCNMKTMATIGIFLFGLILICGLYKLSLGVINASKGIYNYSSGYLRDLILTELIVIYALSFSLVVFIKTRKK